MKQAAAVYFYFESIILEKFFAKIGKRKEERYYIDREVGQFPPPNEFLLCAKSGRSKYRYYLRFPVIPIWHIQPDPFEASIL